MNRLALLALSLAVAVVGCGKKDDALVEELERTAAPPVEIAPLPRTPIMDERQSIADPLSDGWESEALADQVALHLKGAAASVVAGKTGQPQFAESTAFFAALGESFADRHSEIHVFEIQLLEDGKVKTTSSFEGKASNGLEIRSAVATWETTWRREGDQLDLTSCTVRDLEFSRGERWFTDKTGAVLGGNESYQTQLAGGLNHWLARVERLHGMDAYIRNGLAVGDADGDGLDDVYLCQPGGLPNRLFLHRADGTAGDVSADAGVDYLDHTSSALFLDLDNDGDQDLVLAVPAGLLLLENDGKAKFSERGTLTADEADVHALAAADYDLDGNLDLYVTFALAARQAGDDTPQFVYHDANDGGANQLFRGDGGWSFSEVTERVGLDQNNTRHSLAASWHDYDLDGDPDLYVANDYGQNNLYRNDLLDDGSRKFTDVAVQSGAVDFGSGMSVSWGDYDRDGLPDLYVGNMFSNAGHRITSQPGFGTGGDEELRSIYRRFAKGNSLFRGLGGGRFEETGAAAGVEHGRWAWSSVFADLDHDGWEDLFVANGYISGDGDGDL